MIGQKYVNDIFQVSLGMLCHTPVQHEEGEVIIQEKRQIRLFLKAFDHTRSQSLHQAQQWLDELAEEVWHITGFGIYQGTITSYQHEQPLKVVQRTYAYEPATRLAYLFSIEFLCSPFDQRVSLPYAYPQYTKCFGDSVRLHYTYRILRTPGENLFINDALFRRFVCRFEEAHPFTLYFWKFHAYHAYQHVQSFSLNALPKSRQSVKHKSRKQTRKRVKTQQRQQAQQQAQERKAQGKPPVPEKIYLIEAMPDHYKIGVSIHPRSRLRELQTSHPYKLTLIHTFVAEPGKEAEEKLHRFFHTARLKGEWFQLTSDQRKFVEQLHTYEDGKFGATEPMPELARLNAL